MSFVAVFLGIFRKYSEQLLEKKKEHLPMDVPYFINKHLQMSAFDEANGSKFENLEHKMVPVLAALMILEAVNN